MPWKKGDPNHPRRGRGSMGPGHGGPPQGASTSRFSAEEQPPPEAKSAGWEVRAQILERIAARKAEIVDAQLTRAVDPYHPQGHQAAKDLLDRLLPPETKTTVAMTLNPDEMSDEELAAIAAGGRRAPAGSAPDQE